MAARLHNAFERTILTATRQISTRTCPRLPLAFSSPSSRRPVITTNSSFVRMASSAAAAPRTYEWLVVVPDKPGMMAKRLEVRPQHFEGLTKAKESGLFKMGGAVLEDMPADDEVSSMKFAGSTIIVVAESKEAVVNVLKDDIYVKSGVWDLEKAQIWPTKIAFRFP